MSTTKNMPEVEKKGKISDVISAYKKAYEKEQKEIKQISVTFYKGDIKNSFNRKSDNKGISIIGFPKDSIYYGYVFFHSTDRIYKDKNASTPLKMDQRWIYIPEDYSKDIYLSEKDKLGKYYVKDKRTLSAIELKEAMKRKRRENK